MVAMTVTQLPKILGAVRTPADLRGLDTFSKKVVTQLPEIENGYSLAVDFNDRSSMKLGRKRILMAGSRLFGVGLVVTRSKETVLYVWLKDEDRPIAKVIRDHRKARQEVCDADQQ